MNRLQQAIENAITNMNQIHAHVIYLEYTLKSVFQKLYEEYADISIPLNILHVSYESSQYYNRQTTLNILKQKQENYNKYYEEYIALGNIYQIEITNLYESQTEYIKLMNEYKSTQSDICSYVLHDINDFEFDEDIDIDSASEISTNELSKYIDIWSEQVHDIYEDDICEEDIMNVYDKNDVLKDKYSKIYDIIVTRSYPKKISKKKKNKSLKANIKKKYVDIREHVF